MTDDFDALQSRADDLLHNLRTAMSLLDANKDPMRSGDTQLRRSVFVKDVGAVVEAYRSLELWITSGGPMPAEWQAGEARGIARREAAYEGRIARWESWETSDGS